MTALPVAIQVTRYRCPFCTRSRARKSATAEHIARCWHNPEVRACLSCAHHCDGGDACGCEPGCNWGNNGEPVAPSCSVGLPLGEFGHPNSNCPMWQANTEES